MLLCYITDRRPFSGDQAAQRRRLLDKIAEAARAGVDFIQLREKDLSTRDLERLAREAVRAVADAVEHRPAGRRETGNRKRETASRLLINSRADVALAAGAGGVHLRGDDVSVPDARLIFARAGILKALVGVSCHTRAEVEQAASGGADFVVFAPVFEKSGQAGVGLEALRDMCRAVTLPVLALGGVTLENARACITAGAAGVAAIRLFQENDVAAVVRALHAG
jgi:thiamine-phosphate pyrophosphorylase